VPVSTVIVVVSYEVSVRVVASVGCSVVLLVVVAGGLPDAEEGAEEGGLDVTVAVLEHVEEVLVVVVVVVLVVAVGRVLRVVHAWGAVWVRPALPVVRPEQVRVARTRCLSLCSDLH
jgi:hypothetical protein